MGDKAYERDEEEIRKIAEEIEQSGDDEEEEDELEVNEIGENGALSVIKVKEKRAPRLSIYEFLTIASVLTAKSRQEYPTKLDPKRVRPEELLEADIKAIKITHPKLKITSKRYKNWLLWSRWWRVKLQLSLLDRPPGSWISRTTFWFLFHRSKISRPAFLRTRWSSFTLAFFS